MAIFSSVTPGPANASRGRRLPDAVVHTFGDLRLRIDGQLQALTFAPDGSAWTLEEPGVLRHWSLPDGFQLSKRALNDTDMVWTFGPDARQLASGGDELSLWDVSSGRLAFSLEQPSWLTCLAFRGDGKVLATGSEDGVARLWGLGTRSLLTELAEHDAPLSAIAISVDGKRIAAAAEDKTICLWDAGNGNFLGRLVGHSDRIQALAWHANGRLLMSCGWDTTTRVWDTATFETVMLLNGQGDQVTALVFNPSGTVLATADSNPAIWLWDHARCKSTHTLRGHTGEISCLTFSKDGQRLLSGGQDRRLILWDAATGQKLSSPADADREAGRLDLRVDGRTLAYANGSPHVRTWEVSTGQTLADVQHDCEVLTIAQSLDGRWIATGDLRGRIQLRTPNTGRVERTLDLHKHSVTALAFSSDSRLLASAGGTDGYVYLWSLDSFEPALLIPVATENCTVESIAFIPGTTLLAAGGLEWLSTRNTEGVVCVWDYDSRTRVATFNLGTTRLAVRPDGQQLAVASTAADSVCLFDLESCTQEGELEGHGAAVTGLAYGGRRLLATGCEDGVLRVWDADNGELVALLDLDSPIRDVSFSPDGRSLFTAHASAIVHRIDMAKLAQR